MERDFEPYYGDGAIQDGYVLGIVWLKTSGNPWTYKVRNTTEVRATFARNMAETPSVDRVEFYTAARPDVSFTRELLRVPEGRREGGCIVHDMGDGLVCKKCGATPQQCAAKCEPYAQGGVFRSGGLAGLPAPDTGKCPGCGLTTAGSTWCSAQKPGCPLPASPGDMTHEQWKDNVFDRPKTAPVTKAPTAERLIGWLCGGDLPQGGD